MAPRTLPDRGRRLSFKKKLLFSLFLVVFLAGLTELGFYIFARHYYAAAETAKTSPTGLPMLLPDEQTIWSYRKNHSIEYDCDGRHISSSTNSWGLHDEECTAERLARPNRIMAVGDSFTFGWGVPLSATYWKQTANLLNVGQDEPRYEAFGAGYWMSTFDQHLLYTKRYLDKIKPAVVVHGVFHLHVITMMSHHHELDNRGKLERIVDPCMAVTDGRLHYVLDGTHFHTPVAFPYSYTVPRRIYNERLFLSKYYGAVSARKATTFEDVDDPEKRPQFDEAYQKMYFSLREMQEFVTARNARYVIVLIPQVNQVVPNWNNAPEKLRPRLTSDYPQNEIREFCQRQGIECIDPLESFRNHPDRKSLYFEHDVHLSDAGHALLAQCIADYLKTPTE